MMMWPPGMVLFCAWPFEPLGITGGSKITGSGCEYWDYSDPNMWNNDYWDNDWKHDNDNWSHWDSATGVRVSVLACLLAGAAAAL